VEGIATYYSTRNRHDLKSFSAYTGTAHGFSQIVSQCDLIEKHLENKTSVNKTLREIFVTAEEHFMAYCRCTEVVKAIQVPAVAVQPNRDLQQCAELLIT
jgi:hypothetical protein